MANLSWIKFKNAVVEPNLTSTSWTLTSTNRPRFELCHRPMVVPPLRLVTLWQQPDTGRSHTGQILSRKTSGRHAFAGLIWK